MRPLTAPSLKRRVSLHSPPALPGRPPAALPGRLCPLSLVLLCLWVYVHSDFLLSFRWVGSLVGEAAVPLSEEKPPQGFRIKSQKRGCFGEKQEQFPGFPDSTAGPPFSSGSVCFG